MQRLAIIFFFCFASIQLFAQSEIFAEIILGPKYPKQIYFNLDNAQNTEVHEADWDIGFSVLGSADAGIHINEALSTEGTPVELFVTNITDWQQKVTSADFNDLAPLLNEEQSWELGAFNTIKDNSDAMDYGWGKYDPQTHELIGNKIFVIRLRTGRLMKIQIEKMVANKYQFRYADLDGTNEVFVEIDKSDFEGKTLVCYSLTNHKVLDKVNHNWDLLFTRYTGMAADKDGSLVEYVVTGALSNHHVLTAEVEGLDPSTVRYSSYAGALQSGMELVGHDWKTFDFDASNTYQIDENRTYFIQTDQFIWKVVFLDFEGSTTGVIVFKKEKVGTVSAIEDNSGNHLNIQVYPNPVSDWVYVTLNAQSMSSGKLSVTNNLGQIIYQYEIEAKNGLNAWELPVSHLTSGLYYVTIESEDGRAIRQFVK